MSKYTFFLFFTIYPAISMEHHDALTIVINHCLHVHQENKPIIPYKDLVNTHIVNLLQKQYRSLFPCIQLMSLSKTYVNFLDEPRIKNFKQQLAVIKLAEYAHGLCTFEYQSALTVVDHIRSSTIAHNGNLAHFMLCIATGDIKRRVPKNSCYLAGIITDIVLHELKGRQIQFSLYNLLKVSSLGRANSHYPYFINRLTDEGVCMTLIHNENDQNAQNIDIATIFNSQNCTTLSAELKQVLLNKKFVFAEIGSNQPN